MSGVTLNKGDLITVAQKVGDEYKKTGDIKTVIITREETSEELKDLKALRGKHLYNIVHNGVHEDLSRYGVNIGHFTLKAVPIQSLSFAHDDYVLVNGEIEIPDKPRKSTSLEDECFFDEDIAQTIATALNKIELEKFKELQDSLGKAMNTMENIVKNRMV